MFKNQKYLIQLNIHEVLSSKIQWKVCIIKLLLKSMH